MGLGFSPLAAAGLQIARNRGDGIDAGNRFEVDLTLYTFEIILDQIENIPRRQALAELAESHAEFLSLAGY